jgi:hypothetical protein
LPPGLEGLRSDILLLADAGIVRGPVTTWPMSWPDIARDVAAASESGLDAATEAALLRVRPLARAAAAIGFSGIGARASAAKDPVWLRSFVDTPREEGEVGLRASWLGDHLALNLQGAAVADAEDGKTFRADGSYLGVNIGNFMLSAGLMERWWGPGFDGSLALSTNARPIPSITLERNYTDAFKSSLLGWLGPWRASIAVGEAETHGVTVPEVRFLAARVNFKPRPWLELGLTRTAQWCGGDRECGWQTFKDMLLGRDNRGESVGEQDEPGNQMAGYDARLRSPWKALPLAVYTQWMGEDEAGGLPSKFLGLFGAELWGNSRWGGYRAHIEYADTTCTFTRQEPDFNCAYRNEIYPQGYVYRGRSIGDPLDNDSRMFSLGVVLTGGSGAVFGFDLRKADINRDGGNHAISEVPTRLYNVELRYSRAFRVGNVSLGLGYDDWDAAGPENSRMRGYLLWQQGF